MIVRLLTGIASLAMIAVGAGSSTSPVDATQATANKPVMLYVNDSCSLMELHAGDRKPVRLHASQKCPEKLYVQKDGSAVFLVYKRQVVTLKMNGGGVKTLPFPLPDFPAKCSWLRVPFAQNDSAGTLDIEVTCMYPWDATENYLYARRKNKWMLERHESCGRFEQCNVAGHLADNFYAGSDVSIKLRRKLWMLKESNDPYLSSIRYKVDHHADYYTPPTRWAVQFDFNGTQSLLTYTILYGPDTGAPTLGPVSLQTADGRRVAICKYGCEANLLGRYLIVYRYVINGNNLTNGYNLIDLATGKTLKRGMELATWRY